MESTSNVRDWISLIPFGAAVAGFTFIVYKAFAPRPGGQGWINPNIKKDNPKVVDVIDVEDISEKAAFCRCWKSKKFPYCDGAHGQHNKETGDNVGPICVQRKAK
ncbi:CDGSH iron-sulfur domain-containing protein 2 homolog isoform X2 [Anabrus simplex]|uniref:CDGSH iron-sulfur domain-containing protein 2 homolog isoform X2 n=1 Tax=Anabrus simplex TaxID=316456 RepID=UPI0034DD279C